MRRKAFWNRGGTLTMIVAVIAVGALAGASALLLGGRGEDNEAPRLPDRFQVKRGSFDVTIPASGELAALKQIEIRNPLENSATITFIVDEGTKVKAGDVVLRLAQDELERKIREDELELLTAENALTAAKNELEIQQSANESEVSAAQLEVELAVLTLQQWRDGDLVSKRQELTLEKEKALRNLDRLKDKFESAERLLKEEFISKDEYELDRINLIEAEANLKMADLAIVVYENYEYKREEAEKSSAVQQAQDELERVQNRHKADIASKQADVAKAQGQFDIRAAELAKLKQDLANCTIVAPAEGLVVYYSSLEQNGWRSDREVPQIGGELRGSEPIMILPDTSQMIAAVKVNEALSGLIKPGQRATVISDAMPDTGIQGEVLGIGVLASTYGWRDPNRRDYTVRVKLSNGHELGLKPSMRCSAQIHLGRVENALFVPIQAVFRSGGRAFVYVPQDGGYAQKQVEMGRVSELNVELLSGVAEGDTVLLRSPAPDEIVSKLPPPPDGIAPQSDEETEADQAIEIGQPLQPGTGKDDSSGDAGGSREGRPNGERRGRAGDSGDGRGREGGDQPGSKQPSGAGNADGKEGQRPQGQRPERPRSGGDATTKMPAETPAAPTNKSE